MVDSCEKLAKVSSKNAEGVVRLERPPRPHLSNVFDGAVNPPVP